jgi:hypothetical protein
VTGRELAEVRHAVAACRTALNGLQEGLAAMERELRRVERLLERQPEQVDPAEVERPRPALVALVEEPRRRQDGLGDLLVDRVEELGRGCEALLQRSLRSDERPVVLAWAQLEREGQPVPVGEILGLTRHLLSRPTPDGTLPGTLRWCESTVQTLSRAPLRSLGPGGRTGRAAELSALYDRLADELDAREAAR